MTKSAVTKTWIGGLIVFAAGVVAALIGVFLMLGYGGSFIQVSSNNWQFNPDVNNGFFWTTIAIMIAGGVIAAVGGLVQLAAWIAALANSYHLPDKAWFTILLIGGIIGLFTGLVGFAVMAAYVIAAPDGLPYARPQVAGPRPGALPGTPQPT